MCTPSTQVLSPTAAELKRDECARLETEAAAAMPSVDDLIKQLYTDMNAELPPSTSNTGESTATKVGIAN